MLHFGWRKRVVNRVCGSFASFVERIVYVVLVPFLMRDPHTWVLFVPVQWHMVGFPQFNLWILKNRYVYIYIYDIYWFDSSYDIWAHDIHRFNFRDVLPWLHPASRAIFVVEFESGQWIKAIYKLSSSTKIAKIRAGGSGVHVLFLGQFLWK